MVRRLGLGKNNHLTYTSLALNPRYTISCISPLLAASGCPDLLLLRSKDDQRTFYPVSTRQYKHLHGQMMVQKTSTHQLVRYVYREAKISIQVSTFLCVTGVFTYVHKLLIS